MHEHAPSVDWSELYATPAAPLGPLRERMLAETSGMLNAFHQSLSDEDGPGAIVECTPIRVGRYPQLLVDLARRTQVHIIASTGFWCEALAPQHPWAVRLGIEPDGRRRDGRAVRPGDHRGDGRSWRRQGRAVHPYPGWSYQDRDQRADAPQREGGSTCRGHGQPAHRLPHHHPHHQRGRTGTGQAAAGIRAPLPAG